MRESGFGRPLGFLVFGSAYAALVRVKVKKAETPCGVLRIPQ